MGAIGHTYPGEPLRVCACPSPQLAAAIVNRGSLPHTSRVRSLSHERCFNHFAREAVARCPECGRFFCRECVTEHDDRVVCAACLKKLALGPSAGRARWLGTARAAALVGGLFIAWVFFYWVGQTLLRLPSSFHDGTVWKGNWLEP